jgi:hypothetical protein
MPSGALSRHERRNAICAVLRCLADCLRTVLGDERPGRDLAAHTRSQSIGKGDRTDPSRDRRFQPSGPEGALVFPQQILSSRAAAGVRPQGSSWLWDQLWHCL